MVVRLLLEDGTIREYEVAYQHPYGIYRTKCHTDDCEHLACAIDYQKAQVSTNRWIRALLPLVLLFGIGMVVFFWFGTGGFQGFQDWVVPFMLFMLVLLAIVILFGAASFREGGDPEQARLRELQEFEETGTVNGIPARQIFKETMAGESPSS